MSNETKGPAAYVRRVQEGTHRYTQDLLAENGRLQSFLTSLEVERNALAERVSHFEELQTSNEALKALTSTLEAEKGRLQEQLIAVRNDLDRRQRDHERLENELAEIHHRSQRFSEQYAEVELQNSNLANLYVASYRLHSTLDQAEVLAAIAEIVANLIGSEEMAVYETSPDGTTLDLLTAVGLSPDAWRRLKVGDGPIGQVAATGENYVASPGQVGAPPDGLTACVALKLDGRVTGVIAIFRLLPQKSRLETVDFELFDLLGTHAATALYCTRLHTRFTSQSHQG